MELIVFTLILVVSNAFFLILGSKLAKKEPILAEKEKYKPEDFEILEPEEMAQRLQTNADGKIKTEDDEWEIK